MAGLAEHEHADVVRLHGGGDGLLGRAVAAVFVHGEA
jgi:hypothetical protein